MRVAILTIHHVPNYGAVMQAYGLKSVLSGLGHDCDVINYRPDVAIRAYKEWRGRFPKSLFQWGRHQRIERFVNRYVSTGNKPVLQSSSEVFQEVAKYDAVICGSDQIWNVTSFRGVDETFFLGSAQLPSTKKISYAPSIGSSDPLIYSEKFAQCKCWLEEFDSISVRDIPSQKMVEGFGLRPPKIVCDPTLLPQSLAGLASGFQGDRDILLVYGVPPIGFGDQIRELAEELGLKIISVGSRCSFADKNHFFADPKEWLQLFERAKLVVTGMFHGVQLAFLNNVPPLFVGSSEKRSKVTDALNRYQLEDLWIESSSVLKDMNFDAVFAKMNDAEQRKNQIATDSLEWLSAQLN